MALSGNVARYEKEVNINNLGLTKEYEFSKVIRNNTLDSNDEIMEFIDCNIDYEEIETKHASKIIKNIISKEEAKTLEFGTDMHEILELTDFKNVKTNNKYINNLLDTFNFKDATIYQELEFVFVKDDIKYYGIIDLMLEYSDKICIIDYKLKTLMMKIILNN